MKFNELQKIFKTVEYKKNQIVFHEGEACQNVCFVNYGQLTISTYTSLEKEEIIQTLSDNDLFGDLLIFSSHPVYLGDVITNKKTSITFIPKDELIKLFQKDQELLLTFLSIVSNKSQKIKQQNKLLAHKSITDRLIYYFSLLSKEQKSKTIVIPKITQLALELSLPRESISRVIKELVDKGIIKKNKKIITLL